MALNLTAFQCLSNNGKKAGFEKFPILKKVFSFKLMLRQFSMVPDVVSVRFFSFNLGLLVHILLLAEKRKQDVADKTGEVL